MPPWMISQIVGVWFSFGFGFGFGLKSVFFFFHGKLFSSVRLAAFLQAEDRPMFKGLKSDSIAHSHVCLGRPTGRLQSGDGFRIAVETAL